MGSVYGSETVIGSSEDKDVILLLRQKPRNAW